MTSFDSHSRAGDALRGAAKAMTERPEEREGEDPLLNDYVKRVFGSAERPEERDSLAEIEKRHRAAHCLEPGPWNCSPEARLTIRQLHEDRGTLINEVKERDQRIAASVGSTRSAEQAFRMERERADEIAKRLVAAELQLRKLKAEVKELREENDRRRLFDKHTRDRLEDELRERSQRAHDLAERVEQMEEALREIAELWKGSLGCEHSITRKDCASCQLGKAHRIARKFIRSDR